MKYNAKKRKQLVEDYKSIGFKLKEMVEEYSGFITDTEMRELWNLKAQLIDNLKGVNSWNNTFLKEKNKWKSN